MQAISSSAVFYFPLLLLIEFLTLAFAVWQVSSNYGLGVIYDQPHDFIWSGATWVFLSEHLQIFDIFTHIFVSFSPTLFLCHISLFFS